MSGSGQEALPDVREWPGGHPGCTRVAGSPSRVVRRPSRTLGSGRETIPEVREWSGGAP